MNDTEDIAERTTYRRFQEIDDLICGITGALSGAALGQMIIPIPGIGALIGAGIGALGGAGLGPIGGRSKTSKEIRNERRQRRQQWQAHLLVYRHELVQS